MRLTRDAAAALAALLLLLPALAGCGTGRLARLRPGADPRLAQAPMTAAARAEARAYFARPGPKALAFSPETGGNGYVWGTAAASAEEAERLALGQCEELTGTRCELFAVNDEIVWRPRGDAAAGAGMDAAGTVAAATDADAPRGTTVGARTGLVGTFDLRGGRGAALQVVNPSSQELLLLAAFYDDSGTPLRCRVERLPAGGLAEVDARRAGVKARLGVVRMVAVDEGDGRPVAGLVGGTPGLQPAPAPLGGAQLAALGRLCGWRPGTPSLSAAAAGPPGGRPEAREAPPPPRGRDEPADVALLRAAAERGDPDGQNVLGVRYRDGRGVARDDAEAARWFRAAAERGDALGQFNLGVMYSEGRGVARDEAEAARWYKKAAEQGDADAKDRLARLGG